MKCPTCNGIGYEDGVPCGNCRQCHRCPGCGDVLPEIASHCDLCGWSAPEGLTTPLDPLAFTPQIEPFSDEIHATAAQPPAPDRKNALRGLYAAGNPLPEPPLDPSSRLKPKDTKDLAYVMAAGGYSAKRQQVYRIRRPSTPEQFDPSAFEKDQIKFIDHKRPYEVLFDRCRGGSGIFFSYRLRGDNTWLEPLHSLSSQEMNRPYWPVRAHVEEHLIRRILGKRVTQRSLCDNGLVMDRWQVAYFMLVYNLWLPGAFKYTDKELAAHMSGIFLHDPKGITELQIRHYRRVFNMTNPNTPLFRYMRYPFDAPRPSLKLVPHELRVYICKNHKWLTPVERIYPTRGTGVKYLLEKIPKTLQRTHKSKPVSVKHIIPEKPDPQVLTNAIDMAEKEMSDGSSQTPLKLQADGVVEKPERSSGSPAKRTRRKARKVDPPYCGFDTFPGWQGNS